MHLNGYPLLGLRRKLLHFLRLHPDMFGAVHPKSLYEDIMQKFWVLFPEDFIAGPASLRYGRRDCVDCITATGVIVFEVNTLNSMYLHNHMWM